MNFYSDDLQKFTTVKVKLTSIGVLIIAQSSFDACYSRAVDIYAAANLLGFSRRITIKSQYAPLRNIYWIVT